ncbi:DoxX family membrane protein [Pseudodesulfovibrio sp. JC047]|uniref:MauE/DoxX family redox-associated membrane protein n=1 Tax=Pseudodesulfovibrio sp. JC047 TaxID=2683199 RepID=UPI0013D03BBA|nr:MauE/DoxX family redox-associated membrane protein [Pseudodesulfovibrio sp. JC047]NDV18094.1 DoxX family membrane protein [Pseudodesulfovibrio sp. JC047]
MNFRISSRTASLALRLLLGGLFVYAGILKISHPYDFAMTINQYGLVTWRMATALSSIIPSIEIISGLGLILNIRGALALVVAQLLGFMVILLYALSIGLDADCGCFGTPSHPDAEPTGPIEALIRDALMVLGCVILYWHRRTGTHVPKPLSKLLSRQV